MELKAVCIVAFAILCSMVIASYKATKESAMSPKVIWMLAFAILCSMVIAIFSISLSLIAVNRAYNPPDPEPPWRALRAPSCTERKP